MPKVMRWVADQSAEHSFRIEPATYEQAKKAAGFRLDRRRNYWITEDVEVEEEGVVTLGCSGCSCGCEGMRLRPIVRMQRVRPLRKAPFLLRLSR